MQYYFVAARDFHGSESCEQFVIRLGPLNTTCNILCRLATNMKVAVIITVFVVVFNAHVTTANNSCKNNSLQCYDCASTYDEYCRDPFNHTLSLDKLPPKRFCSGCCTKIEYNYPNKASWIERSCTESDINFSWLGNCFLKTIDGYITVCVCNGGNLCNAAAAFSNCPYKYGSFCLVALFPFFFI